MDSMVNFQTIESILKPHRFLGYFTNKWRNVLQ